MRVKSNYGSEHTFGRTLILPVFSPSYGYSSGKYKPRKKPPSCIVVHETGPGPERRINMPGVKDLVDAACLIYAKYAGNNGPHYVVGKNRVAQTCPENYVAFHTGSSKRLLYKTPLWKTERTEWWRQQWAGNPLQLDKGRVWEGGSVNNNSIGIECVGVDYHDRLVAFLNSIRNAYAEHGQILTVFGHCDVDPLSRSGKNGRYDPKVENFRADVYMAYNPPVAGVIRP